MGGCTWTQTGPGSEAPGRGRQVSLSHWTARGSPSLSEKLLEETLRLVWGKLVESWGEIGVKLGENRGKIKKQNWGKNWGKLSFKRK